MAAIWAMRTLRRRRWTTYDGALRFECREGVIHGEGTVHLTGDYHRRGEVTFSNAGLNSLAALIVKESDAKNLSFDGTAEGSVDFNGPLRKPAQITASFDIPHSRLSRCRALRSTRTSPVSRFRTPARFAPRSRTRRSGSRALASRRRKPTSRSMA